MDRLSLSDAAYAALGAGRPDAATLAHLRRAALSRHLLLLREIVRAAPDEAGPWYARLCAEERTAPEQTRARLADPLFGAWAAHRLRALRHGGPRPAQTTEPHKTDGRHAARAPKDARRLSVEHDGLTLRVRLDDTDPRRALLGLVPADRLTAAETAHWQTCLTAAWRLLVERHRPDARILAAVLELVVPVRPDPSARGISATSADAYGAVAMSAPADGTALAVGLLHEAQHSVLNAVTALFDLVGAPAVPDYSPWRDDPRPPSGLLHGAYAYLAVTRFWRAEAAATGDPLAAFEFARWREAVAGTADRLRAGGALTAAGARFVDALRAEVGTWLDEPVEPRVARLAGHANADHRLRWRLRNRAVDPGDAAALAAAWRRGARPPRVESRLVPSPRRALENSARLDLMHHSLRGDTGPVTVHRPGGRASAGDAALLGGDHGTALSAYQKGIVAEPADDAAWTGLALVADRLDRLEVVVAGYRALGARPDPLEFASWISG
ncbi:aKG-HExxH-type peptide beta-hydroxylase [Jidongwangia harbinensis]|uniref:aKG-HExxH-type peptide beta-hydroxylase n=1 Tax=Jidongwangia harbinensis TaxID=2878561 RepID=UPI001CD94A4C|nr:HEXXH motif-containing putative peptide modification protein [Jidongwangia harbinensis]MCA2215362.1 HEXXH motif domain-containing protein [Jidongwangia harbinensis]